MKPYFRPLFGLRARVDETKNFTPSQVLSTLEGSLVLCEIFNNQLIIVLSNTKRKSSVQLVYYWVRVGTLSLRKKVCLEFTYVTSCQRDALLNNKQFRETKQLLLYYNHNYIIYIRNNTPRVLYYHNSPFQGSKLLYHITT